MKIHIDTMYSTGVVSKYMAQKTSTLTLLVLRLSMSAVFLWAFFDKLLGLGNTTKVAQAWINGGSPTKGFLTMGIKGNMFQDFFTPLAGLPVVDFLFMFGLLGIGLTLLFGVALRFASYAGALLMALMYVALLPVENNPLIDDHVVYALVLILLGQLNEAENKTMAKWWSNTAIVKALPFLG